MVDTLVRTSLAAKHSLWIGAPVAEAGKLEFESVCFDLPDMVEEVVDLLAGCLSPDTEEERRLDIAVRLTKPARRQRLHRAL